MFSGGSALRIGPAVFAINLGLGMMACVDRGSAADDGHPDEYVIMTAVQGGESSTDLSGSRRTQDPSAVGTWDVRAPTLSAAEPESQPTPSGELEMTDCVTQVQPAQRVVVDMHFMLDRSISMSERTASGQSKWDAVASAFATFLSDDRSVGLRVSVQYFPLSDGDVPEVCASDLDCGESVRCQDRACRSRGSDSPAQFCRQDSDCDGGACVPLGRCSLAPIPCFDLGSDGCGESGACVAVVPECSNFTSCDGARYGGVAVEVTELPAEAPQILSSLEGTRLLGSTPTGPALEGALTLARARAGAEPEHGALVVLVTDGTPTACSPSAAEGVADIAARALAGDPPIPTYVIGVFAEGDAVGVANAQRWALAGGTESALIVRPELDVATQFLDALEEIRVGSVRCEYALPAAPPEQVLDLSQVNVAFTQDGGGVAELLYVGGPAGCAGIRRGWHYDVEPDAGTPARLQLCPQVCRELTAQGGGRLDIHLGCQTEGPQ